MFNKNFYPTPGKLTEIMLSDLRIENDFSVLEPSAGKGDIADYIKSKGTQKIDVIEIEEELQNILFSKGYTIQGSDFLKFEPKKEYDVIAMNPPFDEGVKHLLHAIEIAENQSVKSCKIRCILNAESIKNTNDKYKQKLKEKVAYYGHYEFFREMFIDAERKTNVEVAVIRLEVIASANTSKVDSILSTMIFDQKSDAYEVGSVEYKVGMKITDIDTILRLYDEITDAIKNKYFAEAKYETVKSHLEKVISIHRSPFQSRTVNQDIEEVRGQFWEYYLFSSFQKTLTGKTREDFQRKIGELAKVEFTRENIEKFSQLVVASSQQLLEETVINLFEKFTANHLEEFSKNIHYYSGWKTNTAFAVNEKIILPMYLRQATVHLDILDWNGRYLERPSYRLREELNDIVKCMQLFSNKRLSNDFIHLGNGVYETEEFKVKVYKKGTVHFTFKNKKILKKFNYYVATKKMWLPTSEEVKRSDELMKKFIEEFGEVITRQHIENEKILL